MRLPTVGRAIAAALPVASIVLATTLTARSAAAQQRDIQSPLGDRGTLVIDQLSGFRASTIGGVGYAGPIGFSTQTLSEDVNTTGPSITQSIHYTSFWFAPSLDYFVIDHLSIGGVLEVATTSESLTTTTNGPTQSQTTSSLPTITNITFLPRVGWMFAINERFGIWPRLGLGYTSRAQGAIAAADGANNDTFSAFVVDLDVGFLYRVNQNWFLKAAPELTFAPGSWSHENAGVTTSTGGSFFQFSGVGGIGVMWDLL